MITKNIIGIETKRRFKVVDTIDDLEKLANQETITPKINKNKITNNKDIIPLEDTYIVTNTYQSFSKLMIFYKEFGCKWYNGKEINTSEKSLKNIWKTYILDKHLISASDKSKKINMCDIENLDEYMNLIDDHIYYDKIEISQSKINEIYKKYKKKNEL